MCFEPIPVGSLDGRWIDEAFLTGFDFTDEDRLVRLKVLFFRIEHAQQNHFMTSRSEECQRCLQRCGIYQKVRENHNEASMPHQICNLLKRSYKIRA
jgi:hypothetical protein